MKEEKEKEKKKNKEKEKMKNKKKQRFITVKKMRRKIKNNYDEEYNREEELRRRAFHKK